MKMFRMLAASMLSAALCLGFTACSDDDENENGEGGGSTVTVVKPSEVFKGRTTEVGCRDVYHPKQRRTGDKYHR